MKLAQVVTVPIGPPINGPGPLGTPGTGATTLFDTFLSSVIGVMTIVAGIWFLFQVFTGAIAIISSKGDKQALEAAKKKITTGLIGIVIVVAAIFLVDLVGTILGVDFLSPGAFVDTISPLP